MEREVEVQNGDVGDKGSPSIGNEALNKVQCKNGNSS